jgi:hypothetical protein
VNIPLRLSSKPLPQTLIVPKSLPEEQLWNQRKWLPIYKLEIRSFLIPAHLVWQTFDSTPNFS